MANVLKSGRSFAISFDVGKVKGAGWFNTTVAKVLGGGHAIVVNGMRWNKKENRCEIHLRNSWGPTKKLNGWASLDDIVGGIDHMTWLQPKTN
jgi:hypothetical protein